MLRKLLRTPGFLTDVTLGTAIVLYQLAVLRAVTPPGKGRELVDDRPHG